MCNELERVDTGLKGIIKALTMTNSDIAYLKNRGAVNSKSANLDVFLNSKKSINNALLSGGNPRIQTSAILSLLFCVDRNGLPVVVFHDVNRLLEQNPTRCLPQPTNYREIDRNCLYFNPLLELNTQEIVRIILNLASRLYNIKTNARYSINGIMEYIEFLKKQLRFKRLSICPNLHILYKYDALEMQGRISDCNARNDKSKLMMRQSKNHRLNAFHENSQSDMQYIAYMPHRWKRLTCNQSALKRNQVLCFDFSSITIIKLLCIIVHQPNLPSRCGTKYMVFFDSIPAKTRKFHTDCIGILKNEGSVTISENDSYSVVGRDDGLFSTVFDNMQTINAMNHSSGSSALKWSEVFGKCDKLDEQYSVTHGKSQQRFTTICD